MDTNRIGFRMRADKSLISSPFDTRESRKTAIRRSPVRAYGSSIPRRLKGGLNRHIIVSDALTCWRSYSEARVEHYTGFRVPGASKWRPLFQRARR